MKLKRITDKLFINIHYLSEQDIYRFPRLPYIAARCAQQNSLMNISEGKMLDTVNFLKKKGYNTPIVNQLYSIFSNYTFTRVRKVEMDSEITDNYRLLTSFCGFYIAGIGHIFVN
jgi:hypothetical protein